MQKISWSEILSQPRTANYDKFVFILLTLIGFLLYAVSLQAHYFFFDDKISIEMNPVIHSLKNLGSFLDAFNTRVVVGLSFGLNYWFSALDPRGYRLVNLLIHIAVAFAVYDLCYLTLSLFSSDNWQKRRGWNIKWTAFWAGLIFLVHPVQTEPVNFLTQRFVLLASFSYVLSLILYIRARVAQKNLFYLAALSTTILAMLSKEIAFTLPFVIGLYEFYSFNDGNESLLKRTKRLTPFLLALAIIPFMLATTPKNVTGVAAIAQVKDDHMMGREKLTESFDITKGGGATLTRLEYFLTELNVIRTYLKLLIIPLGQNIDYDFPSVHTWRDPGVILSAILIVGILCIGILIYKYSRILSFFIFWFFITLAVDSSVIPVGHVIAEYRVYLPSVGFAIVLAVLGGLFLNGRIRTAIVLGVLCLWAGLTIGRNYLWADETRIWKDAVEKSPNKLRPYINLAGSLYDHKQYAQAVPYLQKAISLAPDDARYVYNLGLVYRGEKDFDHAIQYLQKAIALQPNEARFFYHLGITYKEKKDLDAAITNLKRVTDLDNSDADTYHQLGYLYFRKKDYVNAVACYQRFVQLEPTPLNVEQYFKMVLIYYRDVGDKKESLAYAEKLKDFGLGPLSDELTQLINTTVFNKP